MHGALNNIFAKDSNALPQEQNKMFKLLCKATVGTALPFTHVTQVQRPILLHKGEHNTRRETHTKSRNFAVKMLSENIAARPLAAAKCFNVVFAVLERAFQKDCRRHHPSES